MLGAIRDGFGLLTWEQDSFAYAESYDEAAKRYRGLRGGQNVAVSDSDAGLLVRPEVARRQIDAETTPPPQPSAGTPEPEPRPGPEPKPPVSSGPTPGPVQAPKTQAVLWHGYFDSRTRRARRKSNC